MPTTVVFETHSTTEDNEAGRATGWLPGRLSETGRAQAAAMGERRRGEAFDIVFCSDLARAVETVAIAFDGMPVPVLFDWRLRECNYGEGNGMALTDMEQARRDHIDRAYPRGESWRQATDRVQWFVDDLVRTNWAGGRVLVVGHTATRWGLERAARGVAIEELVTEQFEWQPGWEFVVA